MKTLLAAIAMIVMVGVIGWAQNGQTLTNPPPGVIVTNTISNLPETRSIPPPATNVTIIVTNSIPAVPRIDTSGLVQQFTGTDAVTKEKVSAAIDAIHAGNYRVAAEYLRQVLANTAMTPDQSNAIKAVLNMLPQQ